MRSCRLNRSLYRATRTGVVELKDVRSGFTLVEVMAAILLFGVGMLAIFTLSISLARMNGLMHDSTDASALAEAKIEELHQASFAALASGADSTNGYTRIWTLTPGTVSGSAQVNVTVSWGSNSGRSNSISHATILGEAR